MAFTRNTSLVVSATWSIHPSGVEETFHIKGEVEGTDMKIPSTVAVLDGNELTIYEIQSNNAFPDEIGYFDPFEIEWEYSVDGGEVWQDAGTSANTVYVTLAEPQVDKLFRTVVDISCRGAAGKDGANMQEIVDGIWGKFANPTGGNGEYDVTTWDGRPLHYYKTPDGSGRVTTAGLLSDGDGQCHAWVDVFKDCLHVHAIPNVKTTQVNPPDVDGYRRFAVNKIDFDDEPGGMDAPPWLYVEEDLDTSAEGIAGQNVQTPKQKLFQQHYLVRVGDSEKRYDPSYGLTVEKCEENNLTVEAVFTKTVIAAWEFYSPPPLPFGPYWRKVTSEPELTVQFEAYEHEN